MGLICSCWAGDRPHQEDEKFEVESNVDGDVGPLERDDGANKVSLPMRGRLKTFVVMNNMVLGEADDEDDDEANGGCRVSRASDGGAVPVSVEMRAASKEANQDKESDDLAKPTKKHVYQMKSKMDILENVQTLVDVEYDILKAEVLLGELEGMLEADEWDEVLRTDLFERFARKLNYYSDVGQSCFDRSDGWFLAYQNSDNTQSIHGCFDAKDSTLFRFRVRAVMPASLTKVLLVSNELELMPNWNKLVVGKPTTVGRRTKHYMIPTYQLSVLGGMVCVDSLNEVRRFTDVEGGFMAEFIESVPEDHPAYKPALKGYKRPSTVAKNVWVACGPDHTMLIQAGQIQFPFSVSKWVASSICSAAGTFVIGGLVKNSLQASVPGHAWEDAFKQDKLGFYARLDELVASKASKSRKPSADGSIGDFDLTDVFNDRKLKRMAASPGKVE